MFASFWPGNVPLCPYIIPMSASEYCMFFSPLPATIRLSAWVIWPSHITLQRSRTQHVLQQHCWSPTSSVAGMDGLMLGRAWWPQMAPGINRKYSAKKCKEPPLSGFVRMLRMQFPGLQISLTLSNLLGAPKEKLYQESWWVGVCYKTPKSRLMIELTNLPLGKQKSEPNDSTITLINLTPEALQPSSCTKADHVSWTRVLKTHQDLPETVAVWVWVSCSKRIPNAANKSKYLV